MLTKVLDDVTRANLQRLVQANFACRDELYLAAKALDDEDRMQICQRLAEQLADHGIYMQQVLAAIGADVPEPPCAEEMVVAQFKCAQVTGGANAVLEVAEQREQFLKEVYDHAIQSTPDNEATGMMRWQRRDVEFGERVLRSIRVGKPK